MFLIFVSAYVSRARPVCSPLDDTGDEGDSGSEGESSDGESSDGEDGVGAPKRNKKMRGGRVGKAKAPPTAASVAAAAGGDMSAPDLVEDLGAWSDDEWA